MFGQNPEWGFVLVMFSAKTKDLADGGLDAGLRHWVPFWRLDSTRTPGLHTWNATPRSFTRAVAGCSIYCLPKETTINFHIRMMPIKREHRMVAWTRCYSGA